MSKKKTQEEKEREWMEKTTQKIANLTPEQLMKAQAKRHKENVYLDFADKLEDIMEEHYDAECLGGSYMDGGREMCFVYRGKILDVFVVESEMPVEELEI